MVTKIIIPLDGSHLAQQCLPLALKLGQLLAAQLCLVKVVPPTKENILWDWSHEAPIKQKGEAEAYLQDIVEHLTSEGEVYLLRERVYSVVVEGQEVGVGQSIAREAHTQEGTLILMTTHGRGGLTQLVLGSTALEIIRNTSLPVIFLRPEQHRPVANDQDGLNLKSYKELEGPVVVTLDGSREAELALKAALELAGGLNLPVHLLRVLQPFVPVDQLAPWYEANLDLGADYLQEHDFLYLKEQASSNLAKTQIWLKDIKGVDSQTVLKVGEPINEIINYASSVKASLVVMATHAHGRVEQAFLGSVAGRVMCRGNFPVMMVNIGLNLRESKSFNE